MAAFKLCFCSFCQKASGSAHVSNVFTHPDKIVWQKGAEDVTQFDVANSQVRRVFCKQCGTSLPFVTQNGEFLVVPVGSLSRAPSIKPGAVVNWASRPDWYDHAAALIATETQEGVSHK